MSRRWEIIAGAVVLIYLLWMADYRGWAALVAVAGGAVLYANGSYFHTVRCWCKNGWVESPFGDGERPHRACGGTGRRRRLALRVFRRRVK